MFGKAMVAALLWAALPSVAIGQDRGRDNYDPSSITGTDEEQLQEMTSLYDAVCLKAFPQDGQVEAMMKVRGAVPMTEADVASYLHDDAGVGWVLVGRAATFRVLIEHPPYHACSVRSVTRTGFSGLSAYASLVERELKSWPRHETIAPQSFVVRGVQTEMRGEGRLRGDGQTECLLLGLGRVVDPALASRLTGIEVRFVHQFVIPAKRGTT